MRFARLYPHPHLLTIGRLIERKGVAWFLLEVLPLLLLDFPLIHYSIVGTGPQERLIKKIIQEKDLQDHVSLHEQATDAERDTLLSGATLLVTPNIPVEGDMEGFGMVCIEASGRGVPVCAARLEGLSDAVIEGRTGHFFHPLDPADCARVIRVMIESPLAPGEGARATMERYAWPRLLERYHREVFGGKENEDRHRDVGLSFSQRGSGTIATVDR